MSELLTYAQLAERVGVHPKTIQRWASKRRPIARRLRTVHVSRKTVYVRPNDWERFLAAGETTKGY